MRRNIRQRTSIFFPFSTSRIYKQTHTHRGSPDVERISGAAERIVLDDRFQSADTKLSIATFVSFNWNKTPNFFLPYTPNRCIECCCFIAETREKKSRKISHSELSRGSNLWLFLLPSAAAEITGENSLYCYFPLASMTMIGHKKVVSSAALYYLQSSGHTTIESSSTTRQKIVKTGAKFWSLCSIVHQNLATWMLALLSVKVFKQIRIYIAD